MPPPWSATPWPSAPRERALRRKGVTPHEEDPRRAVHHARRRGGSPGEMEPAVLRRRDDPGRDAPDRRRRGPPVRATVLRAVPRRVHRPGGPAARGADDEYPQDRRLRHAGAPRLGAGGGRAPDEQMYADMGRFVEELARAGVLLATGGLDRGTHVSASGGNITLTDGPFTESKEVIVSFALIEARSKDEAVELARRFWKIVGDGEGDIRQVYGPEG